MSVDHLNPFDQKVLVTVRRLMADNAGGVSPAETISLLGTGTNAGLDDVETNFPLAVDRLRQGGLLMSNPSGQLCLTSAGKRQMLESTSR